MESEPVNFFALGLVHGELDWLLQAFSGVLSFLFSSGSSGTFSTATMRPLNLPERWISRGADGVTSTQFPSDSGFCGFDLPLRLFPAQFIRSGHFYSLQHTVLTINPLI